MIIMISRNFTNKYSFFDPTLGTKKNLHSIPFSAFFDTCLNIMCQIIFARSLSGRQASLSALRGVKNTKIQKYIPSMLLFLASTVLN